MILLPMTKEQSALTEHIANAVQDVLPGNDFELMRHEGFHTNQKLALKFSKGIDLSDVENILEALERKHIYSSYMGFGFSEENNNFIGVDLKGFTDSRIYMPAPLASARLFGSEMERYIAIDKYNDHEAGYHGRVSDWGEVVTR